MLNLRGGHRGRPSQQYIDDDDDIQSDLKINRITGRVQFQLRSEVMTCGVNHINGRKTWLLLTIHLLTRGNLKSAVNIVTVLEKGQVFQSVPALNHHQPFLSSVS